jgi:hypothetical protein
VSEGHSRSRIGFVFSAKTATIAASESPPIIIAAGIPAGKSQPAQNRHNLSNRKDFRLADEIDTELAKKLRKALKQPRNFALIARGVEPLKLFVQKKPLKMSELKTAKSELGGKQIIIGICQGDGGKEIVFQVEDREPRIRPTTFRKFIAEQSGLALTPRFEVVEELGED